MNCNGIFETEEYTFIGTDLNETLSIDILVPTEALLGQTRIMRFLIIAIERDGFMDEFLVD